MGTARSALARALRNTRFSWGFGGGGARVGGKVRHTVPWQRQAPGGARSEMAGTETKEGGLRRRPGSEHAYSYSALHDSAPATLGPARRIPATAVAKSRIAALGRAKPCFGSVATRVDCWGARPLCARPGKDRLNGPCVDLGVGDLFSGVRPVSAQASPWDAAVFHVWNPMLFLQPGRNTRDDLEDHVTSTTVSTCRLRPSRAGRTPPIALYSMDIFRTTMCLRRLLRETSLYKIQRLRVAHDTRARGVVCPCTSMTGKYRRGEAPERDEDAQETTPPCGGLRTSGAKPPKCSRRQGSLSHVAALDM